MTLPIATEAHKVYMTSEILDVADAGKSNEAVTAAPQNQFDDGQFVPRSVPITLKQAVIVARYSRKIWTMHSTASQPTKSIHSCQM